MGLKGQEDPIFAGERPENLGSPPDFLAISLTGEGTSIAPGKRAAAGPGQARVKGVVLP